MTFEVQASGTRRTIEVHRVRDGWAVAVDGRAMSASVSRAGGRWSLLYGPAGESTSPAGEAASKGSGRGDKGSCRSYEVVLEPRHKGDQLVHIKGRLVQVSFLDRYRRSRTTGSAGGSGARDVVAPMPGRIVKLLVQAGDRVAANQGLVVVEAMKMENELRAPREGTVASVRVSEGMSVEANAVLVVVE